MKNLSQNEVMQSKCSQNFLSKQITYCIEKINENANKEGEAAAEQWHYWQGALKAYQSMAEYAEEIAATAE